ncbi:MAG: apolipoprotein N-acyltransferase [Prolixibacteraceae bacterium]|nr:apolipoprotein N-acyltransferase [Prolixibacteraceae bacterium]
MKFKLLLGSVISGILLSIPWYGFTGMVLFVAFIPLFYIEDYFLKNRHNYNALVFWLYMLPCFLVWNVATTWWITYATVPGAIFAYLANSFLMSVVWWLSHVVKRYKGISFGNVFFVFLWIGFEYLHYNWDISWPWLTLGNGFANDIQLIQWYEYTGVFGGTLWVLLLNLMLWSILKKYLSSSTKLNMKIFVFPFLVVVIPIFYSLIRYFTYKESLDPVEVVIAQPNIDPYSDKFSGMSYEEQLRRLIEVSDSLGTETTDFFVGPETALHEVWENKPERNRQVWMLKRHLRFYYPGAAFISGASAYREFKPGDIFPEGVRFRNDSTFIFCAYNAALFLKPVEKVGVYHKSKLVSGVEKMPYQKYLKFLETLIIDLGGMTGTLCTQEEPSVFKHKKAVVGVPICYESGYGEYMSGFIKKGANLIFVITNDGWWKDSPGYRQHLSFSRLRAVEFRRSIARSANTGISCFINQRGDILQKTRWWQKTSIRGQLNLNNELTVYARMGDYIGRAGVFMLALMALSFIVDILKGRVGASINAKKNRINPD